MPPTREECIALAAAAWGDVLERMRQEAARESLTGPEAEASPIRVGA